MTNAESPASAALATASAKRCARRFFACCVSACVRLRLARPDGQRRHSEAARDRWRESFYAKADRTPAMDPLLCEERRILFRVSGEVGESRARS